MVGFVQTLHVLKSNLSRRMPWTYGSARISRFRPLSSPGFEHRLFRLTSTVPPLLPSVFEDFHKRNLSLPYSLTGVSVLPRLFKKMRLSLPLPLQMQGCACYFMQYAKLPFPSATATLLPYTCHCGATHLKLCAMMDIPDNAVLLIGEAAQWRGCLVQFDGSAHKKSRAGGAGVSLLQVTPDSTTLVRWKSTPLLDCPDNVMAEAHACLHAVQLATEFHHECLRQGVQQDGVVIQGDILPLLNYLQGRGRIKRLAVVKVLEECQQLLARAPFIFRLVYLPRECNKLADHFAGVASAAARKAVDFPLHVASHRAPPPYHLAQKLGFIIDHGALQAHPAFVLTECPAPAPPQLAQLLQQTGHVRQYVQDYLANAGSCHRSLTIGYKPSAVDGKGRFYAVGIAAQRLPRKVRLLLFGEDHYEIDISGAHYELTRRCCAASGVHLALPPVQITRKWLREKLGTSPIHEDPAQLSAFVKTWPLVIINNSAPQEAISFLQRQFPHLGSQQLMQLTRFAHELHAASRHVIDNPPTWCPERTSERNRADPFRFFEHLEQQLTWAAYNFLQPILGFRSVIWLHDGFWVHPGPTEDHLTSLHIFLCQEFCFSPTDPPLFRSEQLLAKRTDLLAELAGQVTSPSGVLGGVAGPMALPPQLIVRRKRTYQVASNQEQLCLEERLNKRARVVTDAKKRRLR